MTFTHIFNMGGDYLPYRDYWVLTLGFYAGVEIVTGSVVSVLSTKYGDKKPEERKEPSIWKYKVISGSIAVFYLIILFILALLNGLFVFGGASILLYTGVLVAVQVLFAIMGVFTRLPYLPDFLVSCSNWAIAGSAFFLIQIPSMFDLMSPNLVPLVAIASGVPLAIKAGISYMKVAQSDPSVPYRQKFHRCVRRKGFYFVMLLAMAVGIVITYFFAGTCITVYDPNVDGVWVPFAGTVRWSSRWTRYNAAKPCPGPGPCHVFLTAGQDLTSQVFVNVHLPKNSAQTLTIDINNGQQHVPATEFDTPVLDPHDERLVYAALVSGLSAGSIHSFRLFTEEGQIGETYYEFRTSPASNDPRAGVLNFVVTGDGGTTGMTEQIMAQMVAARPYVAIIGGDVAYDNAFFSCACVWDKFISMWESNRVDNRFLVPLTLAAGNHDLGVNDNNHGAFEWPNNQCNPEKVRYAKPLFFAWFPLEANAAGQPLPVCSRTTMHRHSVAGLINLWILDSAYATSTQDNVDYVNTNMAAAATNFAVYHVPLYSSHPGGDSSDRTYLQDSWIPGIFDKYGFTACFENHEHSYKRTKPLYNNQVATQGPSTIYLGDGKMGVEGLSVPDLNDVAKVTDDGIFARTGTEYHFFNVKVSLGSGSVQIDSMDQNGIVFDGVTPNASR